MIRPFSMTTSNVPIEAGAGAVCALRGPHAARAPNAGRSSAIRGRSRRCMGSGVEGEGMKQRSGRSVQVHHGTDETSHALFVCLFPRCVVLGQGPAQAKIATS